MRKALLSFWISVLIVFALSFSTSAEEYADTRDSRYIPPEILTEINSPTTDVIVKVYNCGLIADFEERDNIEEILARLNDPEDIIYIKNTSGELQYKYLHQENFEKVWSPYVDVINVMLQELKTMEAISSVSPDIVVEGVYYLYGSRFYRDHAIYYKTNLGDYVFDHSWIYGDLLLFTAERFFEYKRAEVEIVYKKRQYEHAHMDFPDISDWDLSVYDYRAPNFNPAAPLPKRASNSWIGFAVFVLPLAAVLTVCIIVRKKSMQE